MGENQWATRAAVALIALLTLGYFALQAGRYFSDPFSTTLTYRYEVEESMELSGYVVRQEQALAGEDSPFLRPSREEGERVSAGGVVAVVYADQASLDLKAEAEADISRLEQLYYAQDMEQGVETVSRLDGQILARLTEYRAALAAKRLDRANEQGTQIRALVLKRDYSHDSPETLSEEIAALESRLEELEAISERVTRNITAPASGLYSAVTDGYERILTPEAVREMTPTAFAAALDTERPEMRSGRSSRTISRTRRAAARFSGEVMDLRKGTSKHLSANGAVSGAPVQATSVSQPRLCISRRYGRWKCAICE